MRLRFFEVAFFVGRETDGIATTGAISRVGAIKIYDTYSTYNT